MKSQVEVKLEREITEVQEYLNSPICIGDYRRSSAFTRLRNLKYRLQRYREVKALRKELT